MRTGLGAGLTVAAIAMRQQTELRRRLHFCAMSILLGPGFGRLLPIPLLGPWAWEVTAGVCLLFPLVGILADLRRDGRVHPAWGWGVTAMRGLVVLTEATTYSPVGAALYRGVAAGSPGADVSPLVLAPPPAGRRWRCGRHRPRRRQI